MPRRIKRVTMYALPQFRGQEKVLDRLKQRDLVSIKGKDSRISVFPQAGAEALDDEERLVIYRLLGYSVPDPDLPEIVKRAGLLGGRAAVAGTRTPVWHVVDSRRQGASDPDLRRHYGLSDSQLEQVFAYYDRHTEEIERDIFDNQSLLARGERR